MDLQVKEWTFRWENGPSGERMDIVKSTNKTMVFEFEYFKKLTNERTNRRKGLVFQELPPTVLQWLLSYWLETSRIYDTISKLELVQGHPKHFFCSRNSLKWSMSFTIEPHTNRIITEQLTSPNLTSYCISTN